MKIFFDHKIFVNQNYGGPSRYIASLVNYLNYEKDVSAKIFAPFHINGYLSTLNNKKFKFGYKLPFSNNINKYIRLKKGLMRLNDKINNHLFNKFSPDIFHTTYYDNFFFPENKKTVLTVHDLIHEIFRKDYGFPENYFPKEKAIQRADQIICVSNSTKKDLMRYYSVAEDKITVIYHSSPFENSNNDIKELNLKILKEKYFLYVGSRWKYKNFSKLLKALNKNKKILNDHKLVLFGGGKITNEEIKEIKNFNVDLDKIVHLSGDENLLKNLYKFAQFFIYPSKYEGFGIPILESFSQNCPVICSDTSSLPEVAGDAALYFDPNDEESILEKISVITSDKKVRDNCIQKGLNRLSQFSWKKCASETINVYNKLFDR
ncbi:glycosyltransferase family 4 protein [Candidatus Pelagibacter communis]|uniref:glycosyltransferase family 4 protein n=1 Tax=Pelagibacter ubique TaxID=198252 RepID=UPI00094CACE6|nr:glycosyltransferase family 1 protein [Candidatus Pelagibacter ubique]